jgi:hypothetical protein
MIRTVGLLAAITLGVLTVAHGTGAAPDPAASSAVDRLLSGNAQERAAAEKELLDARMELVSRLISLAKDVDNQNKRKESVCAAMFVLGEMRAPEAVDMLVSLAAFPKSNVSGDGYLPAPFYGMGTTEQTYKERQYAVFMQCPLKDLAAVQALVKIGEPAVGPIMKKLSITEMDIKRYACLRFLVEVKGLDGAKRLLKEALGKEGDEANRERLQMAIRLLDKQLS